LLARSLDEGRDFGHRRQKFMHTRCETLLKPGAQGRIAERKFVSVRARPPQTEFPKYRQGFREGAAYTVDAHEFAADERVFERDGFGLLFGKPGASDRQTRAAGSGGKVAQVPKSLASHRAEIISTFRSACDHALIDQVAEAPLGAKNVIRCLCLRRHLSSFLCQSEPEPLATFW
jgi:hypothetical protein